MAYDERALRGVGGWLAFFVVIMAVIQPLRIVVVALGTYNNPEPAAMFGDAWPFLRGFELALNALAIAGGWYIAWRLNKVHTWQSVRVTIAGIWILGVGVTAIDLLAVSLIGGLPLGQLATAAGLELVRPIIFGAIWTTYFLRSRRVANTYASAPDSGDLAEVFD